MLKVFKDLLETSVLKVLKVPQDHKVLKVLVAVLVLKVFKVP